MLNVELVLPCGECVVDIFGQVLILGLPLLGIKIILRPHV